MEGVVACKGDGSGILGRFYARLSPPELTAAVSNLKLHAVNIKGL